MTHTDVPAHFRQLAARFTTVVEAVPPEKWEAPSPCEGWSVRDVVVHVVDTQREFLSRMPFGSAPVAPTAPGQPGTTTALMAAWHDVRDAMQTGLDDPATTGHRYDGYFGPTTFAETVDTFYSADLLVHAWDVASGAGLTDLEALDPDDMSRARANLEPLGDTIRSTGVYGTAIELTGDETEQQRFLAWTGRRS